MNGAAVAARDSWKVPVNLLAVEAPHECSRTVLENKTYAIIPHANAVIFAFRIQAFKVGNLLKSSGGFDLFDHLSDSAQQAGIGDCGQIRVEGFPKACVHATRRSRWKILFRLVLGVFSPS